MAVVLLVQPTSPPSHSPNPIFTSQGQRAGHLNKACAPLARLEHHTVGQARPCGTPCAHVPGVGAGQAAKGYKGKDRRRGVQAMVQWKGRPPQPARGQAAAGGQATRKRQQPQQERRARRNTQGGRQAGCRRGGARVGAGAHHRRSVVPRGRLPASRCLGRKLGMCRSASPLRAATLALPPLPNSRCCLSAAEGWNAGGGRVSRG